jgi:hypothetical protein
MLTSTGLKVGIGGSQRMAETCSGFAGQAAYILRCFYFVSVNSVDIITEVGISQLEIASIFKEGNT